MSIIIRPKGGGRLPVLHGEPSYTLRNREVELAVARRGGHFSDGLEIARQDRLKSRGIPTTALFRAGEVKSVRVIHLVHPVPAVFGWVAAVERGEDGSSIMVRGGNRRITIPVDWGFLHG